jgi:hypothetical protein
MTVTLKDLVPTKILEPTNTEQYVCRVAGAIIDKITVFNTSDTTVSTLDVVINKTTDAIAAPGLLMQKQLQPLESYTCPEISGHSMVAGDRIVTGTTVEIVTMRISGREIT